MRESVILLFLLISSLSAQFLKCAPNRPSCCDTHQFCMFWSQRNECNLNPTWMRRNCQLSCQMCSLKGSSSTINPFINILSSRHVNSPAECSTVMPVEVETRQVFSADQMRARHAQLMCAEVQIPSDCSTNICFHRKFRSIDGTCNNIRHPIMGAAFSPFSRLLPSAYDDGINALVASITRRRPNPREVSIFLLSSHHTIGSHANSMLMQFGQFVSHDITKNALSPMCTCQTGGPMCANVLMPPNDGRARSCIPFTRSFQVCGTGIPGRPREQYNENTAYIDGSLVYSSEAITLRSLRIGAMLRTNIVNGRVFPPNNGRDSMTAGDSRATIFLGLAAMHTTFLRLHNNLAAALMNMNRHWNQDRVFQETRKIVGSIIQVITYQEFLPALIGPFHARLVPPYRKYDANVNPAVINEFAGAAYRLHGMIQETYPLIGSNFESRGQVPFLNGVGRIEQVLATIDAVYRGFIATPARNPQRITTSVTEQLFSGDGDMATFNIQRGRDHGFRSYNEYRKLCQLKPVKSFEEWPEVSDSAVQSRIAQLYQTPDDLDLYVGGIIEEPIDGSAVGPTFACIIAEQFVRLRDGDRFFYENDGVFSEAQLSALKKITLSWVLCETGDSMTRIVPSAFTIDRGQQAVPCSSIVGLDLSAWKD